MGRERYSEDSVGGAAEVQFGEFCRDRIVPLVSFVDSSGTAT